MLGSVLRQTPCQALWALSYQRYYKLCIYRDLIPLFFKELVFSLSNKAIILFFI